MSTRPDAAWWHTLEAMILNATSLESRILMAKFLSTTLPLVLGECECTDNIRKHLREDDVMRYVGADKTQADLLSWLVSQHNMVNRDKTLKPGERRPRQYSVEEVMAKYLPHGNSSCSLSSDANNSMTSTRKTIPRFTRRADPREK